MIRGRSLRAKRLPSVLWETEDADGEPMSIIVEDVVFYPAERATEIDPPTGAFCEWGRVGYANEGALTPRSVTDEATLDGLQTYLVDQFESGF